MAAIFTTYRKPDNDLFTPLQDETASIKDPSSPDASYTKIKEGSVNIAVGNLWRENSIGLESSFLAV